jgi:hypothetical protein
MKRASLPLLALSVGVIALAAFGASIAASAGARTAMHKRLTRAEAAKDLRGALGAKPRHVQLVWADESVHRVVLEWTAYSPHARIRVIGGPVGRPVDTVVHGPARAWLGADGGPPAGVGTIRHKHRVGPYRTYISVSLLHALHRAGIRVRLAALRPRAAVGHVAAFARLTSDFAAEHARPRHIWLVRIKHHGATWLAWMAVGHSVGHRQKCPPLSHGCRTFFRGPYVGLLNATTGHGMMVTGLRR